MYITCQITFCRCNHPEVFLVKGALKICSKLTGEHPCQSVFSIKLLCNFLEITLWHGCSPVNLQDIFRTPFTKITFGWLLLLVNNCRCNFSCAAMSIMALQILKFVDSPKTSMYVYIYIYIYIYDICICIDI